MAMLETSEKWTFAAASTGAGKAFNCKGYAQTLTWYAETSSGCTCTLQVQTRAGSSAGSQTPSAWAILSTLNCTKADIQVDQYQGPFEWVRPNITDKSAGTVTVWLLGN